MGQSILRQPEVWGAFQACRRALIEETLAEQRYESALKRDAITEQELLAFDSRHLQAVEETDVAFEALDQALQESTAS